jgi:hypothetical protein
MLVHAMFFHPLDVAKDRRATFAVLRTQQQTAVEAQLDTEMRDRCGRLWRTSQSLEISFVVELDGMSIAIECLLA